MSFLRKFNIRSRLIISFIVGTIIFSSVLLVTFGAFAEFIVKRHLYNYLETTQRKVGIGLEFTLDDVTATFIRLLENNNIYNLLSDNSLTYPEKQKKLKSILNGLVIDKKIIGDIFIVTNDGKQYSYIHSTNSIQFPDKLYEDKIKKDKNSTIVWDSIKKDKGNNAYIPAGKNFRNFFTGQNLGTLIIYIREKSIYNIYKKKTPYSGYSFLLSDGDYVISHRDKSKIGNIIMDNNIFKSKKNFEYHSQIINNKSSFIAVSKFDNMLNRLNCHWRMISIISESNLFSIIKKINRNIFLIGIIISLFAILSSFKISSQIVGPVRLLKNKIKKFGNKNVINLSYLRKTNGDEIWELESTYNEMITRISDLMQKNIEEKEKQRELELIALQAQINPHFLYNTLDAIGWIAKLKKQKDIEKLVLSLANFFRISLHKGDKFITVAEEINLVKSFITIELIRFPDNFDIEFDVDESILDLKLLKITLQPLVENAIKHGLSTKSEKGHILVKGKRVDDFLILEVIDDGVGFDVSETMAQNAEQKKYSGYGLKNVDERIKLEYGKDYGISIHSVKNQGTSITIKLKVV